MPTTTAAGDRPLDERVPCQQIGWAAKWEVRPRSDLPAPPLPAGWTTVAIGTSAQGREIVADVRPLVEPRRRVVVIGGVHGNEPVSPPTVRALREVPLPDGVELWLVPELNPDGIEAGVRCNANGVDLNRNFPWGWDPLDGGPAPLSEPEPRAAVALVEHLRPDLVIWVHQPLGYVSAIGTTASALEEAWAAASGVPVRPDVTQHGGGESWTALVAGIPSMLIEIDTWNATAGQVAGHAAGFAATLAALDGAR